MIDKFPTITRALEAAAAALVPAGPKPSEPRRGTWRGQTDQDVLWDADLDCEHDIQDAPGGGVRCRKCGGWFCY